MLMEGDKRRKAKPKERHLLYYFHTILNALRLILSTIMLITHLVLHHLLDLGAVLLPL